MSATTPKWVLGMHQRQGKKRREDKARRQFKRGRSTEEISKTLGVSQRKVREYIRPDVESKQGRLF